MNHRQHTSNTHFVERIHPLFTLTLKKWPSSSSYSAYCCGSPPWPRSYAARSPRLPSAISDSCACSSRRRQPPTPPHLAVHPLGMARHDRSGDNGGASPAICRQGRHRGHGIHDRRGTDRTGRRASRILGDARPRDALRHHGRSRSRRRVSSDSSSSHAPEGAGFGPSSGHFFNYLLAKGFPTAITVMQIGVALVLAIALQKFVNP